MVDRGKKVLFVSNTSFFLYNFLMGLMKRFKNEGLDVVAVAPADAFSEALMNEGFRFIPIRYLNRKGSNPLQDLRLMLELYGTYKRERPTLVYHFTIKPNVYGSLAARLARVRSVSTITGLGWLFTEKSLKTRIGGAGYKVLYRIALSFSEKVFFLNHDDQAFFLTNRLVNTGRCAIVPGSGVDTTYFSPENCPAAAKDPVRPGFLFIGRLLWDKGVAEFVEAARIARRRYPAVLFSLLGPVDQENRSAVPEHVIADWEKEGLVTYLGRTDDVRPYICRSDAVVLPSYREGLPSVLLEAMALGKPVITTDAPGCREVVENGRTGFVVPVKDAPALAAAMMRCIELSLEERQKMGASGREKALLEFDERIVAAAYLKTVRDIPAVNL